MSATPGTFANTVPSDTSVSQFQPLFAPFVAYGVGPTGPQGSGGTSGPKGYTGPTGLAGASVPGPAGPTGVVGSALGFGTLIYSMANVLLSTGQIYVIPTSAWTVGTYVLSLVTPTTRTTQQLNVTTPFILSTATGIIGGSSTMVAPANYLTVSTDAESTTQPTKIKIYYEGSLPTTVTINVYRCAVN